MKSIAFCSVFLFLVASTPWLLSAQTTWTGAGDDDSWLTDGNWDTGTVPNGITFDVNVNSPSPTEIFTGNVNLNSLVVGPSGVIEIVRRNLDFGGSAATTLTNQGVAGSLCHD